jgi:hypothetical protein
MCCVPYVTTVGEFIAKLHAPAGQAPELRCEPMAAARVHPLFSGRARGPARHCSLRHGMPVTQTARVQNALDDVAGNDCQALCSGMLTEVGSGRQCPPRHPTHLGPSMLLSRVEEKSPKGGPGLTDIARHVILHIINPRFLSRVEEESQVLLD